MILEALSERVKRIIIKDEVCLDIVEISDKFNLNEFLDQDNEVFDFDDTFIPELIW